jgi:hypothetical protein
MTKFTTFFAIFFTTTFFAAAASASVTFPISGWDNYDGSERLGLFQEQCGDGWPNGYNAKEASGLLSKVSRTDAGRLLVTCDPKQLKASTAAASEAKPVAVPEAKPVSQASAEKTEVLTPLPVSQQGIRHEHPFPTVDKTKQYPCWIDSNGRHRVDAHDPRRTGLCWGKTAD